MEQNQKMLVDVGESGQVEVEIKKVPGAVGFAQRHWKKAAFGLAGVLLGYLVGRKSGHDEDDNNVIEYDDPWEDSSPEE